MWPTVFAGRKLRPTAGSAGRTSPNSLSRASVPLAINCSSFFFIRMRAPLGTRRNTARKHFSIHILRRAFRLRVRGRALGCAMRRLCIASLAALGLLLTGGIELDYAKQQHPTAKPAARSVPISTLRVARQSPYDLEVGGELAGLPPGATRFITREDLLTLPQVTYTVTDDYNFTGLTKIRGGPLEDLPRFL